VLIAVLYRPARWLSGGALLLLLCACSAPLQSTKWRTTPPAQLDHAVELVDVPFFPQERYQCGPAALATVLAWSGSAVTSESLVNEVYVPARKGSLQPELLAAARRHARAPYVLRSDVADVLREVAAGHPVLVLQNLGLSWAPRWHYAVVVGFDLARERVVLRSGTEKRHEVSLALFERTWRRAHAWAVVVPPPAELPATAEELPYLRAVTNLETRGDPRAAVEAYRAATRRWPGSSSAWFGLGNSLYAAGDDRAAADAYRRVIELVPSHAAAFNNLAYALARLGDVAEAVRMAEAAVAVADEDKAKYLETLQEMRARRVVPQ